MLVKALESPDVQVRTAASGLLGSFGPASAPAIPPLIRLLRQSVDRRGDLPDTTAVDQANWTASALGKIAPGTPQADQAAEALIDALRSW